MKTRKYLLFSLLIFAFSFFGIAQTSFYDLKSKTIDGEDFEFASLKGKQVMVVNTASKCRFTKQYEDLEKLYQAYKDKDFVIIGFPSNDFLRQEPGSNKEIKEFCIKNYGVTFQMMDKISVKGDGMDPVYQWLTQKEKNGKLDSKVGWNFQKYLIDENGNLYEMLESKVEPMDEEIINWIKP